MAAMPIVKLRSWGQFPVQHYVTKDSRRSLRRRYKEWHRFCFILLTAEKDHSLNKEEELLWN